MIANFMEIVQKFIGSSTLLRAHGLGGARATILSFLYSVPPSARKKFWPSNQAGEKEGGWGEGIFVRLFCAVGAVGWEAFPPFGIKTFRQIGGQAPQNNFQIILRKIWRAGVKKLKENCFALLAEFRRAETRSGANQAFFVQNRFELRSVIATKIKCPLRHFIFVGTPGFEPGLYAPKAYMLPLHHVPKNFGGGVCLKISERN